jgi:hypothetical protein
MAISELAKNRATQPRKGPGCTVCLALAELPDIEAAALLALLRDKSWRYSEIAERIRIDEDTPAWVRDIDGRTYARHAGGRCSARVKLR